MGWAGYWRCFLSFNAYLGTPHLTNTELIVTRILGCVVCYDNCSAKKLLYTHRHHHTIRCSWEGSGNAKGLRDSVWWEVHGIFFFECWISISVGLNLSDSLWYDTTNKEWKMCQLFSVLRLLLQSHFSNRPLCSSLLCHSQQDVCCEDDDIRQGLWWECLSSILLSWKTLTSDWDGSELGFQS